MNYKLDLFGLQNLIDELIAKLVALLQRIRCSLRVKTLAVNNFLSVAMTKADQFQTKIVLKVILESTKVAYI